MPRKRAVKGEWQWQIAPASCHDNSRPTLLKDSRGGREYRASQTAPYFSVGDFVRDCARKERRTHEPQQTSTRVHNQTPARAASTRSPGRTYFLESAPHLLEMASSLGSGGGPSHVSCKLDITTALQPTTGGLFLYFCLAVSRQYQYTQPTMPAVKRKHVAVKVLPWVFKWITILRRAGLSWVRALFFSWRAQVGRPTSGRFNISSVRHGSFTGPTTVRPPQRVLRSGHCREGAKLFYYRVASLFREIDGLSKVPSLFISTLFCAVPCLEARQN